MARVLEAGPTTRTNGPPDAYAIGAQIVRAAQTTHQTIRRIQVWPT
jgi:hypothetical protein